MQVDSEERLPESESKEDYSYHDIIKQRQSSLARQPLRYDR